MFIKDSLSARESYQTKEQKYILLLFRLLFVFVVLCGILLFTARINDTVEFTEGEIISSSPQIDLKAPFEAQLTKIYVKEGQQVRMGDTLMAIYNEENTREYIKQQAEKEYLEKKLLSVRSLLGVLITKKEEVGSENKINRSNYNLDAQNIINSIKVLDQQNKLQQQKLATALERTNADSILYHKDMLSRLEFHSDKDVVNSIQESINLTEREMQKQRTQTNLSGNDFLKKEHEIKLRAMEIEENRQNLHQLEISLQNELTKTNENVARLNAELAKQFLIAAGQGTINFIYNSKEVSNIINKGELLLSISPTGANNFYAKAVIPQNNIQYVKANMPANLKLDAYYHLEYGIIRGTVNYVSERKENGKFYALITLNKINNFQLKSGYNVSGQVTIGRFPMFQYFIKKLFKEFDKKNP